MNSLRTMIALCALLKVSTFATATLYPAPSGAPLSPDYQVSVDNNSASVYVQQSVHGTEYSYVSFDMSGSVTVKILCSQRNLANAIIRPANPAITKTMHGDTLVITLDQPRKISIEPDSLNYPLLIFANTPMTNTPQNGAPNVLYYGPGYYNNDISVSANQTLYLAGGAVINGTVSIYGNNASVVGRGIVLGHGIWITGLRNIRIDGITIAGSTGWTIVPNNCDSVTINNVKILNSQQQNEDGIDIVNSRDVWVTDDFIRTDDDNIAIKGEDNTKTCERITIQKCVLWADRADVVRIGYESQVTGIMGNQTLMQDCDIIHAREMDVSSNYWSFCPFALEPADNTPMGNIQFENIRINVDAQPQFTLLRFTPILRTGWGWNGTEYGQYIKNVVVKDISITGAQEQVTLLLSGIDAQHNVDNILFDSVYQYGNCTQANTPGVSVGNFATNIQFQCGTTASSSSMSSSSIASSSSSAPSSSSNASSSSVTSSSSLASSSSVVLGSNEVVNGDFSGNSILPWYLNLINTGAATAAIVSGQMQITITSGVTTDYYVQLCQAPIALVAGQTYVFSFTAKGTTSGTINPGIGQNGGSYARYESFASNPTLTTSMQTYQLIFTASVTDSNARVEFNVGIFGNGTITLDNVSIQQENPLSSSSKASSSSVASSSSLVLSSSSSTVISSSSKASSSSAASSSSLVVSSSSKGVTPVLAANYFAQSSISFIHGILSIRGVQGIVEIYNLQGNLVSSMNNSNDGAFALHLKPGVYIVRSLGLAETIIIKAP